MSYNRGKSNVIGTDWFAVLDRLDEKTTILRNNNRSIDNRYHKGFVKDEKPIQEFCTGSSYAGEWNIIDFCGYGVYHYPHGVTYEGYFENGLYHGNGTITYKIGDAERAVMAKFDHGNLIENSVSFKIGMVEINPEEFNYCKMPDRRYEIEMSMNLKPVGQEYVTNSEQVRKLEYATYDVGYGVFDGKKNLTVGDLIDPSAVKRKLSIPNAKWESWIRKSCRVATDEPVGFSPKNYECWMGGRSFELMKYGFAPKVSVATFDKESIDASSKSSSSQMVLEDKELAQRGGVTRIVDAIEHVIEAKEAKGDMCGRDSISDTEAKLSIFSILEYLEKQYSEWIDAQEEYQKTLKSSDLGTDQALTDDIKEYLKNIQPDQAEEEPRVKKATTMEVSEILSDVDYSLEDMTLTDEEGTVEETVDIDVELISEEEPEEAVIIDALMGEKEDENEEEPREDEGQTIEEEKPEEQQEEEDQ